MHKTILGLLNCKKFLLALIFALLNSCLHMLTKVGVSQFSPDKETVGVRQGLGHRLRVHADAARQVLLRCCDVE
jgi:hypothetical protein